MKPFAVKTHLTMGNRARAPRGQIVEGARSRSERPAAFGWAWGWQAERGEELAASWARVEKQERGVKWGLEVNHQCVGGLRGVYPSSLILARVPTQAVDLFVPAFSSSDRRPWALGRRPRLDCRELAGFGRCFETQAPRADFESWSSSGVARRRCPGIPHAPVVRLPSIEPVAHHFAALDAFLGPAPGHRLPLRDQSADLNHPQPALASYASSSGAASRKHIPMGG